MRWRSEECREDVEGSELWDGGEGKITHNHLQQHEDGFDLGRPLTPLEEAGTTDAWGVSETGEIS